MSELDGNALPNEGWQRLEELFHAASGLPVEERRRYLAQQCAGDSSLIDEVLELLGSDSSVSDLMATPILPDGQHLVRDASGDLWIGRVLDGFRLESLLGRGGMGVVYLGTRVEGILSQRVAIKLIARSLQATPAQRQFLLERDALSSLQHPHIARLVGGGVTEESLPFVVMEYIEGRRLDVAADDPSVTLLQIVQWMLQLCDAVSYVHRNLILHRDLKPGNVMVTAEGSVKLLDFGTLKGIGASAATDSGMTQAGMRPVTLRYASPEHIRGEPGATALDVYSLGMTLYRLLAGQLPAMDETSVDIYLQGLAQDKPLAPSTAMRGQRKQQDPALAADLDAITLKAIRYRAEDRYESADALAADLRRALGKLPVAARARTLRYRVHRFTRRHRSLVAGSTVAALVLIAGVLAMAHEGSVARAESIRADAGIEQERTLAHLLLFDYFDRLKRIPGSTDAQRRAVSQALNYLDSVNHGSLNPALQLDTIQGYTEMGLLQGSQYEENVGDTQGSIATLTKAVASAQDLASHDPRNVKYLQSQASAERALGQVYFSSDSKTKAIAHLTAAADISQRMASLPGVTSAMLVQAAATVDNLGDTLGLPGIGTMNDPMKAIERYQQAAAAYREALRLNPGCTACATGVVVEEYKLGTTTADKVQAAAFDSDGLAMIASMSTAEQATPRISRADNLIRQNLGVLYIDAGRTDDGLALVVAVRQKLQAAVAADTVDARAKSDLALFDGKLATAYGDLQQYPQEADALKEFVSTMDGLTRKDPANKVWKFRLALAQSRYAQTLLRMGQKAEAERIGNASLAVLLPLAQQPDAEPRVLSITTEALVNLRGGTKTDAALAVSFAKRAIAGEQQAGVEEYLALAEAEHLAGAAEESKQAAQKALTLIPAHTNSLSDTNARASANALIHGSDTPVAIR